MVVDEDNKLQNCAVLTIVKRYSKFGSETTTFDCFKLLYGCKQSQFFGVYFKQKFGCEGDVYSQLESILL